VAVAAVAPAAAGTPFYRQSCPAQSSPAASLQSWTSVVWNSPVFSLLQYTSKYHHIVAAIALDVGFSAAFLADPARKKLIFSWTRRSKLSPCSFLVGTSLLRSKKSSQDLQSRIKQSVLFMCVPPAALLLDIRLIAGLRFLVASQPARDLLLCAKHLFVEARVRGCSHYTLSATASGSVGAQSFENARLRAISIAVLTASSSLSV
jgi:hypothetical protein